MENEKERQLENEKNGKGELIKISVLTKNTYYEKQEKTKIAYVNISIHNLLPCKPIQKDQKVKL